MIGKLLGGGGSGGLLGGLLDKLNPMKLLETVKQLPEMLKGMLGGGQEAGGAQGAGGGGPLDILKKLDPMGILGGLLGAVQGRGL